MEFRQLQYFLAVVEEGSVSAASRRVHVAQPALTRQIRLLEEDLETRLFVRHARGMRLTVAGRALQEEARELLDRRARLRTRLWSLGQGVIGRVSLGVTVTHLWVPEVAGLLAGYRDRYPQVAFEVFPLLSGPQLERLQDGSLDAGILYLDDDSQPGLEARLLQRDHLILAVPAHSSWSETPPTSLQDAANADFIWGFREASPHYFDRMQDHFRRLDFRPRVVQYGADNIAILGMVAAGLGIAILPAASAYHPIPGVRFLRLPELDACEMSLWFAWRPDNDSPALHNLVALATQ